MTYETLRRWHRPTTAAERSALRQVADKCGDWPECQQCRREVASCQLLSDEYDSIVWREQDE